MAVAFATRGHLPYLFTNSKAVAEETRKPGILPGVKVLVNSLQPVLSGVAVGAGWQSPVAFINIACYYIVVLRDGEGQLQTTDLIASSNFTGLTPAIVAFAQTTDRQETPSAVT